MLVKNIRLAILLCATLTIQFLPHNSMASTSLNTNESLLQITQEDMVDGDPKAPIKLISYDALSCPHCAEFNLKTIPTLRSIYGDQVVVVHRDFPMDASSMYGAVFIRCMEGKKRAKFKSLLFQTQNKWAYKTSVKDMLDSMYSVVRLGGISKEEFNACIENKKTQEAVLQKKLDASDNISVEATPTQFINGKKYEGAMPLAFYKDVFDNILNTEEKK